MEKFLPIIITFVLMFFKVPVAISLIAGSLYYFSFVTDTMPLTMIIQKLVSSNMSSTLIAVPLFLMIGTIMNYAGITKRLMVLCECLVGHKIGGLGHVNVLLSTVNGGICGSAAADAAMQCKILVPEMTKRGYPLAFSGAVTAASGLISPIIPPGAGLILYAVMTENSVGKMFIAGYVPGILMCVVEMLIVAAIAHRRNFAPSRDKRAGLKETVTAFVESIWSVLIILLLVVGIRMGFFTVSEGAAIIIAICFIVGLLIYKETKIKDIPKIFVEAFHGTSNIMLMILAAMLFGMYLSWAQIPQDITAYLTSITTNKYVFLLVSMLIMLVFGMFLDGTAVLMIMPPIMFPIACTFGVDPIHFGILMIVNCSIGSLTPPFGGVMYVVCNELRLPVQDFIKASWPFTVGLFLLLVLLVFAPEIVTFLPNLIYG